MRKASWWRLIPLAYFLLGLVIWGGFMSAPPDGLANFGVALYVFPITIATRMMGLDFPPFAPASLGYYGRHTAFYFPSLIIITAFIYLAAAKIFRKKSD